jgi:hypothetical protein
MDNKFLSYIINNLKMKKKITYISIVAFSIIIIIFALRLGYNVYNISKLRNYSDYSSKLATSSKIKFYYNLNDSNLTRIRIKYKIDSIAKGENDIDTLINILKWVHNLARHTMNPSMPDDMSSDNLIKLIQKGKLINCWMYAAIFNESCLSMGFHSRVVGLKPYKFNPIECHIVNSVFVPSLKKWIFFDPNFNAYCMDENNNLLGLREIREKLINNEVIKFNKELQYNGDVTLLNIDQYIFHVKSYKDYLTKNMFRFECKMISKYNSETKWWEADKFILIPTKYINMISNDTLNNKKNIYTDNVDLFWQDP